MGWSEIPIKQGVSWWTHKGSNLGPLPCEPQSVDPSQPNSAIVKFQKSLQCGDLLPYVAIVSHSWPYYILYAPAVPFVNFSMGHNRAGNVEGTVCDPFLGSPLDLSHGTRRKGRTDGSERERPQTRSDDELPEAH